MTPNTSVHLLANPAKKRQEKQAILSVSLPTENRTFETSPLIQIYQPVIVQSIVLNSTPKPYPEKSPLGIAPTHQLFRTVSLPLLESVHRESQLQPLAIFVKSKKQSEQIIQTSTSFLQSVLVHPPKVKAELVASWQW